MAHEKNRYIWNFLLHIIHRPLYVFHLVWRARLAIGTALALLLQILSSPTEPSLVKGEDSDSTLRKLGVYVRIPPNVLSKAMNEHYSSFGRWGSVRPGVEFS